MKRPNLFIIGSVKCGTTTLYSYLKKSPEIFFPVMKEPHYFITCSNQLKYAGPGDEKWFTKYPKDVALYEKLFQNADKERIVGEASAMYMYFPNVAEDIYNYSPDAKIIGIVRNPIERAYSHFLHQIRDGMETVDHFHDAITEELEGKRETWAPQRKYIDMGMYSRQLERYYDVFPTEQVKILKFEDFISNPNEALSEICSFLKIADIFQEMRIEKHNVSGVPVYKGIHQMYLKARETVQRIAPFLSYSRIAMVKRKVEKYYQNKFLKKPKMSLRDRNLLREVFADEVKSLENRLELSFNDWLDE